MLLHDEWGHPLLATTHRGDTHLTAGLPHMVEWYERAAGRRSLRRLIVDREGMAAEFLADQTEAGRCVVTVLRASQYKGIESFTDLGEFVPLSWNLQGNPAREVARAHCSLSLPDHPGERLGLRVALVRDLRRMVPRAPEGSEEDYQPAPYPDNPSWFDAEWAATPAPPVATEPALVPIVTTATGIDPVELARAYTRRWPTQENVIRDWLLPLGLDTNHGYSKKPVPNSEAEKRRATLESRLAPGAGARGRGWPR